MFDGQRALAVFVFAGLADGERRARIEPWRDGGQIQIGREGWRAALAATDALQQPGLNKST